MAATASWSPRTTGRRPLGTGSSRSSAVEHLAAHRDRRVRRLRPARVAETVTPAPSRGGQVPGLERRAGDLLGDREVVPARPRRMDRVGEQPVDERRDRGARRRARPRRAWPCRRGSARSSFTRRLRPRTRAGPKKRPMRCSTPASSSASTSASAVRWNSAIAARARDVDLLDGRAAAGDRRPRTCRPRGS